MCVILIKDKKNKISRTELLQAAAVNRDGAGVWIPSTDDNEKINITKSMNPAKIIDIVDKSEVAVFHARISTGGRLNAANIHPYHCGQGRYLFHNGICGQSDGTHSDTALLAKHLQHYTTPDICTVLTYLNRCGKGKFVLVDSKKILFQIGIDKNGRSNENHLYHQTTGSGWRDRLPRPYEV